MRLIRWWIRVLVTSYVYRLACIERIECVSAAAILNNEWGVHRLRCCLRMTSPPGQYISTRLKSDCAAHHRRIYRVVNVVIVLWEEVAIPFKTNEMQSQCRKTSAITWSWPLVLSVPSVGGGCVYKYNFRIDNFLGAYFRTFLCTNVLSPGFGCLSGIRIQVWNKLLAPCLDPMILNCATFCHYFPLGGVVALLQVVLITSEFKMRF